MPEWAGTGGALSYGRSIKADALHAEQLDTRPGGEFSGPAAFERFAGGWRGCLEAVGAFASHFLAEGGSF